MEKFEKFKLSFIGFGAMAQAMCKAFLSASKKAARSSTGNPARQVALSPASIAVFDVQEEALTHAKKLGLSRLNSSFECFHQSQYVFLCIKPQQLKAFFGNLAEDTRKFSLEKNWDSKLNTSRARFQAICKNKIFISILAGVEISLLQDFFSSDVLGSLNLKQDKPVKESIAKLGKKPLAALHNPSLPLPLPLPLAMARIMPNIAALIGASSGAISFCGHASKQQRVFLNQLLSKAGYFEEFEEKHMHAVTALSGSSPAIFFQTLHAMAQQGLRMGLPYKKAIQLAASTMEGSAKLLLQQKDLQSASSLLSQKVCSPAGTTIAGLYSLEKHAYTATLMRSLAAVETRSKELSEELKNKG